MKNRLTWLKTTQDKKIDELELVLEFERWDGYIGNIKAFEIYKSNESEYFVLVSLLPNDYNRNKPSLDSCMERAENQLDIWLEEAGLIVEVIEEHLPFMGEPIRPNENQTIAESYGL